MSDCRFGVSPVIYPDPELSFRRVVALASYIDIERLILHFLVLLDCWVRNFYLETVLLTSGIGRLRDVASASISHEQTQSNRVCWFQTLDAAIQKDLFSDF